ncbi:hypothetical protein CEUSTIGMA_g9990.t1 [Chlamydomonas eustigma]|uniref:Fe2OG dioxygenase domain-containing protein n=1 Tax=Chlamydomonas eustigma TaxID=1157962 RepID=A0A250XHL3_9CHLO|nr:hypothetical protein CEUSTIGMA_g9990.t1 [Chlamydomonas eustigma]|eukprot:GAX82564.1 hypothetical protein CEUSTIGMA_g9990.t1 [Chlamydomonas eustigma]
MIRGFVSANTKSPHNIFSGLLKFEARWYCSISFGFKDKISPELCDNLQRNGYAVVDEIFEKVTIQQIREEVLNMYNGSHMHKNCTHLVNNATKRLVEKHHIHEAELTLDHNIQSMAPVCSQLNNDRSLPVMLNLFMPKLTLESQAIKLQVNSGGGGCFPCHFDSDEQVDGRKVTAIIYANPMWQPGDGGQLRLYPFPYSAPIDIEPVSGRMVLFSSTRMLHRVLPSAATQRVCLTVWLSQLRSRQRGSPLFAGSPLSSTFSADSDQTKQIASLMQPHIRNHVLKMVYAQEWAESIELSHPYTLERDGMVEQHWREVEMIRKALKSCEPTIQYLEDVCKNSHESMPNLHKLPISWF